MSVEIRMARGLQVHLDVPERAHVDGATAREAIDALIALHPALRQFVLDDARRLRQHVNLYINDELILDRHELSDPVTDGDTIYILPAVSGGADATRNPEENSMSESQSEVGLLVSTRKGLLIGRSSNGRQQWDWSELQRSGWIVDYTTFDARTNRIWCSASHWQWGPRLHYSTDFGETWVEAGTPAFDDGERSVEAIWMIEPGGHEGRLFAGIMPAALFRSDDNGASWREVTSLTEHPYSRYWEPGAAGLVIHHISVDPQDADRIVVGGSATGVFVSYDGGDTWMARNRGIRSDHMPPDLQELAPCVHSLFAHPSEPGRLWQQNHFGQYRSDDDGESWIEVGENLPGLFGFPTAIDPRNPDACYFVPHDSDQARMPYNGSLAVFRTRDAGQTWDRLDNGLPQVDFFHTVYRHALGQDACEPLGLYFGSSGGELYGSIDGGDSWALLREHLAPITAVRAWQME